MEKKKTHSISLVIREMQIKSTVRRHTTAIHLANMRQSRPSGLLRRGAMALNHCRWEWKLVPPLQKTVRHDQVKPATKRRGSQIFGL